MSSTHFLLTAAIVVLATGTGVIYTLSVGLSRGRWPSVMASLGSTPGIAPHLLAASLGLAAMLHTSAILFQAAKVAGVAYLLYLAWRSLKSGDALAVGHETADEPGWRVAWRGMVINILNPKLSIFFLALLPPFLTGNPATATTEMVTLGAIFMTMTFAVFSLYGAFAAAARDGILASDRATRRINRGFAAIFAALAGKQALERA